MSEHRAAGGAEELPGGLGNRDNTGRGDNSSPSHDWHCQPCFRACRAHSEAMGFVIYGIQGRPKRRAPGSVNMMCKSCVVLSAAGG